MIPAAIATLALVSLWAAWQFRKKSSSVTRNTKDLQSVVLFLESLNALPPELSDADLTKRLLEELKKVLAPRGIHSRLWIANHAWKTLHAHGEHPAQRPGAPHNLPMTACPAYALKTPFRYNTSNSEPCSSEQFNYAQHTCLPLQSENVTYGVLFLGSYDRTVWAADENHLFGMLAQAIALTLQRHGLFHRLEEKIGDLRFSFEVGAAALATFSGSTHSIEETTVHILDSVLKILKVDRASLMLWDREAKVLQTQWARGGDFKIQSPIRLNMGEGMAGWALKTEQPYWAEYAMGDPHYLESTQSVRSLLCVPVYTTDNEPLGVINAMTILEPRAFLQREVDFLVSFARQAALAIENARLHHKSRANIDQLSEVSKLKSHFLSLVSHDLRGPLTGIRGFCEILKQEVRGPLTGSQVDMIEQLERQVDLQERMVDDLLDLARLEKGRLNMNKVSTDILQLIQEEVGKADMEARDRNVALKLSLEIPESDRHLHLDGNCIRQVIWNLIFNALKFTPESGRITVRARIEEGALHVDVEDTGVGLAKEAQDRVFEKFFQVSPGGDTSAQGLGLGLTICKEIVTAHQGTIRATSEGLGKGTKISFALPLHKPAQEQHSGKLAA